MQTVLGIDLGGTKLTGAVIDSKGKVLTELTIPSNAQLGRAAVLEQLNRLISQLAAMVPFYAIGMGTPGFVNADKGIVVFASENMPGWTGIDLQAELSTMTSLPVAVGNDANLAAIGEAWLGAGRGLPSFMMITLGTGVGGAFYQVERGVLQGSNWRAGEVGHSLLYPGGRACSCGQYGCADQYVSGQALEAEYLRLSGYNLPAAQIMQRKSAGDALAAELVWAYCRDLASLLVSLQNVLDPAAFVLGGGVVSSYEHWGHLLNENLAAAGPLARQITVLTAICGNLAGCYGAARIALNSLVQGTDL